MGHKVHPTGFRIGIIRDWQSKWYASRKQYLEFLHEDLDLRDAIRTKYTDAGVSQVEIDRQASKITVNIYTSRPGIVIGRGGQRVDEMRRFLEKMVGKKIQLNIQEIQQPELDAFLVARNVADQIERHIAYRRAMKQAIFRTMQAGAKGIRISCSGRLGGAEIARSLIMHEGRVPLHTMRADIDYGFTEAHTTMGIIGVKTWIYKGDVLPEAETIAEMLSTEITTEAAPVTPAEPAVEKTPVAEAAAEKPTAEEEPEPEPAEESEEEDGSA